MLDSAIHLEPGGRLSPLEMLETACARMSVVWPDWSVMVVRPSGSLLKGEQDEQMMEWEPLAGVTGFSAEALIGNRDILISCMEKNSAWFHYACSAGEKSSGLLAVIPLLLYMENSTGSNKPVHFETSGQLQNSLLYCSSKTGRSASLTSKDALIVDIMVSQINSYSELYRKTATLTRRLKKLRHDLRTPLTSVTMISGLLQQDQAASEVEEMGQMLQAASEKMDGLLKSFKTDSEL